MNAPTMIPAFPPPAELHQIINSLSETFIHLGTEEVDDVICSALGRIGEFVDVDRVYVYLIAGDRMANTHEWCRDGVTPRKERLLDVQGDLPPWCMSRILAGTPVSIASMSEVPDDQPEKALLLKEDIRSLLAVPILSKGRTAGFVGFDSVRTERSWPSDVIRLLETVGSVIGNAIERKRAEEGLHREQQFAMNFIENARNIVLVFDSTGRCIRANRMFAELSGLSVNMLNGHGWRAVIPTSHHLEMEKAMRKLRTEGKLQVETPLLSRTGAELTILWNGVTVPSQEESPQLFALTGTDLTDVRPLHQQNEQARRIESLGRVTATIAHEFNNVLMSIMPFAELIVRNSDRKQKVEEAAEHIRRAVKRGESITRRISLFARPAELILRDVPAFEWTSGVVNEIQALIADRTQAAIDIDLRGTANCLVAADAAQMQQVLTNLIMNAVEAMPSGGRIVVAVDEVRHHERLPISEADDRAWVHWRVQDSGEGMPPAVLERLFEPLFTTRKRGGGLGLAIAYQIVAAHGGHIAVDTTLGEGSTLHVFLPRELSV